MTTSFNYNNTRISYTDIGSGKLVFLLHGFGEDAGIWQLQKEFLQPHYRLIIPDLPGSGDSDLLAKDNITIDDYADVIYALYQSLQLSDNQQISILGHSMGGYISLAFAKKYAAIVKPVGLIHSTAFADSKEKKQVRLRGIEIMAEYGAFAFLKNTIPNLFAENFKQQFPKVVESLIEKGNQFTVSSLQQYYISMMNREDKTILLKSLNIPVLFIIGTEDVAVPLQDVLQQVHLPYIAQIKILEDVGHMGMLEATDIANTAVLEFLNNF